MHNVLVVEANALGMVAVIRSLGRAKYRVYAISSDANAIGFYSSFVYKYAVNPDYASESFISWLKKYIEDNSIELIVPSEGFLHAIQSDYSEFSRYLADPVSKEVWSLCMSKVDAQNCLERHITQNNSNDTPTHMPLGGVVVSKTDINNIPIDISGPIFIKADHSKAKNDKNSAQVIRCETVHEATIRLLELIQSYDQLLWQQFVPGKKVGVSLWRHKQNFYAENMVIGIHMQPWTGGMMSLRKTFWHEKMLADAKDKMVALGWQGVAMMEYKWDPATDEFWLIEINARYWGYLHLDLYAGKDFPKLQADAFFGKVQKDMGPPSRQQVTCRHTFPGETNYLLSKIKSSDVPAYQKVLSIFGFFGRFLMPQIKSDLYFPGDKSLYLLSLKKFFGLS